MAITPKSLNHTDGAKNMGGIKNKGQFCLHSDILEFPDVPAEITDPDLAAVIDEDITFKATKCFKDIYCTTGKGSVIDEQVGERDCASWKSKGKIFFPGTKAQALGAAAAYQNADLVFLIHESSAAGGKRLIGTKDHPARIVMSSITSGETGDGVKGWTFEVEAEGETPAPIYTGVVTTTPAS